MMPTKFLEREAVGISSTCFPLRIFSSRLLAHSVWRAIMRILSIKSQKELNAVKDELLQFNVHFINKGFFKASDHGFGNQIKNAKNRLEILQAIQNSLLRPGNKRFNLALIECLRKHDHLPYYEKNIYKATHVRVINEARNEARYQARRYAEYHGVGGIAESIYAATIEKEPYETFKYRCKQHLKDATTFIPEMISLRYKEIFDDEQIMHMSEIVSGTIPALNSSIQFNPRIHLRKT